MNSIQKLDLLISTEESFKERLKELDEIKEEERTSAISSKITDLTLAVRFCSYLKSQLIKNKDFGPENISMLDFIGLSDLYSA